MLTKKARQIGDADKALITEAVRALLPKRAETFLELENEMDDDEEKKSGPLERTRLLLSLFLDGTENKAVGDDGEEDEDDWDSVPVQGADSAALTRVFGGDLVEATVFVGEISEPLLVQGQGAAASSSSASLPLPELQTVRTDELLRVEPHKALQLRSAKALLTAANRAGALTLDAKGAVVVCRGIPACASTPALVLFNPLTGAESEVDVGRLTQAQIASGFFADDRADNTDELDVEEAILFVVDTSHSMKELCGPDKHVMYTVGTELVCRVSGAVGLGFVNELGESDNEFRSHGRHRTVLLTP